MKRQRGRRKGSTKVKGNLKYFIWIAVELTRDRKNLERRTIRDACLVLAKRLLREYDIGLSDKTLRRYHNEFDGMLRHFYKEAKLEQMRDAQLSLWRTRRSDLGWDAPLYEIVGWAFMAAESTKQAGP
jgi:hypothetical protein